MLELLSALPSFQTLMFYGLGLKIIKRMVEKYHGNYKVSSTETLFTTNLPYQDFVFLVREILTVSKFSFIKVFRH